VVIPNLAVLDPHLPSGSWWPLIEDMVKENVPIYRWDISSHGHTIVVKIILGKRLRKLRWSWDKCKLLIALQCAHDTNALGTGTKVTDFSTGSCSSQVIWCGLIKVLYTGYKLRAGVTT